MLLLFLISFGELRNFAAINRKSRENLSQGLLAETWFIKATDLVNHASYCWQGVYLLNFATGGLCSIPHEGQVTLC